MTNAIHTTEDINQIRINIIQRRANQHGFALAMNTPPTDTAHIRRAARALDDIITDITDITPRRR